MLKYEIAVIVKRFEVVLFNKSETPINEYEWLPSRATHPFFDTSQYEVI